MESNNNAQLKTGALSLADVMMIGIGGMVGSAIFSLSGLTYFIAGPAALLSWIIAALVMFIYALNMAEMACIFPKSGGVFVFPYEILGKSKEQKTFFGWLTAWSWLNVTVLGFAFAGIYIANYLGVIFPGTGKYVSLLAILWIALCYILNVVGISFLGKINFLLTSLLLIICGVYAINGVSHVEPAMFGNFFGGGVGGPSGLWTAVPIAMLAYGSIISVVSVAEEINDPKRNVPKAIGFSMLATTLLYAIILVVTYGAYSWQEVTPDNFFAIYSPLNYAVSKYAAGQRWLDVLIAIGAILALSTTMLVQLADAGRTLMAVSSAGLLPKSLGKINSKFQTPAIAMFIVAIVSSILACFPQFTSYIINIGSFTFGVTVGIIVITLFVTRMKGLRVEGGFRVPGGYLVPVLTAFLVIVTLTQLDPVTYPLIGIWYLIGLIIFGVALTINRDKIKSAESIFRIEG